MPQLHSAALRGALLLVTAALAACSGGDGSPALAPAAPGGVFANPAVLAADVGWDAVSGASAYRVTARADGQPAVQRQTVLPGLRLSGLQANTAYSIIVQALGADGDASAESAPALVYTPRLNTAADTAAFDAAATYSESAGGEAVVIYRDGQLVYERYARDFARGEAHVLASGTKSFSCAFLLAAEDDAYVSRDQRVADVLTEWTGDPYKSQIRVLDLLSLQSGLSTNPDYSPANVGSADTYALALDDPANFPPGMAFIYDPLAFQAFALMFERVSGRDPIEYLRTNVFLPIGLTGDTWQRDAADHPQMAGGATMSADAWARYGQMMLQGGTWGSRRVLPADGVRDCLTYDNPAYRGYGITWWLNRPVGDTYDPGVDRIPVDGIAGDSGKIAPHAPDDMVMAAGVGHQRLYLLPQQRLVVIRFAPLATENDPWSDNEFLGRLLGT